MANTQTRKPFVNKNVLVKYLSTVVGMCTILWALMFNYMELLDNFPFIFLNIRQSGKCLEYNLQRKNWIYILCKLSLLYITGDSLETNDTYILYLEIERILKLLL